MILWIGEPLRSYWLTMTIVKTTNTDNVNYYECVKTYGNGAVKCENVSRELMSTLMISKYCRFISL